MCNLACTWCDTKYTWDWQSYDVKREVVSVGVADAIDRVEAFDCQHLVVTGGEPLMQQDALAPLVAQLSGRGFYCEVETNGTLAPGAELAGAVSQWNVSPKLANSGNAADRRTVPGALEAFRGLPNAYFKFVLVDPADADEVCGIVERFGLPRDRVILMPEGVTRDAVSTRGKWVADLCERHGFRFSTRLHILLWGDERGR
jgi:organic radical activating enzyme